MKKLIVLFIVVMVMAGIANAQQTAYCDGSPAPTGGCGYYDSDGNFWFTKCIAVNCQSDVNNCGAVGSACASGDGCMAGVCWDMGLWCDLFYCDNGHDIMPPLALKSKHNDITDAVRDLRRKV